MNQIAKAKLSDHAATRWLALIIVSATMMFAYFFTDVMSPLEAMLSESLGWNGNEYGFFSGAYGLINVFLLMLFFGASFGRTSSFTGRLSGRGIEVVSIGFIAFIIVFSFIIG